MKISELISQLEIAKKRHGDLETFGSRTMFGGKFQSYSWRIENYLIVQKQKLFIVFRKMKRSDYQRSVNPERAQ